MNNKLKQTPLTCSGHTRPVVDLAFSSLISDDTDSCLISACKDGKPMLRNGKTGDWIGTFEGHKGAVWGCDLNNDATRAATGAADFTAIIWDSINGTILHTLSHSHIVKCVNFSKDGNYLCTGSAEKLIKIFDLNKVDAEPLIIPGHSSSVRNALLFKYGQRLASVADDQTLRFWDRNTLKEIKRIDFKVPTMSMEMCKDGQVLTVCAGNKVSFWSTDRLEKIKEYEIPTKVLSASLHPDKNVFVCGGDDFKVYKCDYSTGVEIESFKGHFGPVHCVRFSPDGELYASGSEDGTLRLWQTIVGKTYGLWKYIDPENISTNDCSENSSVSIEA